MPIEQMNISLSPQMARFVRGKVKKGEYTNASEVVRDAVRRLQATEAAKSERFYLTRRHFPQRAARTRGLAKEVVAHSARKQT